MIKEHCLHLAILLSAIALIAGCTTTTNVVQPASTGTIIGQVYLYEMDGSASASSAGVDVNILGTSRHAITDSIGHYAFDSLPAGYYPMRFTKSNFTSYVTSTPIPFVGADTLWPGPTSRLYRINNWNVTLKPGAISTVINSSDSSDTLFTLLSSTDTPSVILLDSTGKRIHTNGAPPLLSCFVGNSSNVNFQDSSSYFFSTNTYAYERQYQLRIHKSQARSDTVYLIAYPISGSNPEFSYYFANTRITEFTGFGPPSNVVKIVLP